MSNRNDPMAETVIKKPLADLYSFKNHPFKVQDNQASGGTHRFDFFPSWDEVKNG